MHEASVAQALLQTVRQEAARRKARPCHLVVSCGQLNGLNDEAFRLAMTALTDGTEWQGLTVTVRHLPFRAHCRSCQRDFTIEPDTRCCPHCGSEDFDLLPDAPLVLESIDFQENQETHHGDR